VDLRWLTAPETEVASARHGDLRSDIRRLELGGLLATSMGGVAAVAPLPDGAVAADAHWPREWIRTRTDAAHRIRRDDHLRAGTAIVLPAICWVRHRVRKPRIPNTSIRNMELSRCAAASAGSTSLFRVGLRGRTV